MICIVTPSAKLAGYVNLADAVKVQIHVYFKSKTVNNHSARPRKGSATEDVLTGFNANVA